MTEFTQQHPWVGTRAVPQATEGPLAPLRGQVLTIEAVGMEAGQPAALRVIDPASWRRFEGPLKLFSVGQENLIEDVAPDSDFAAQLRDALSRWEVARDYPVDTYDGLERLAFALALEVKWAAAEHLPQANYLAASQPAQQPGPRDGTVYNWRLVVPDPGQDGRYGVVDCHSVAHDGVWTLQVLTYATSNIEPARLPPLIESKDPWWLSLRLAYAMLFGFGSDVAAEAQPSMLSRLAVVRELHPYLAACRQEVAAAYQKLFGEPAQLSKKFTIAVNDWDLKPGKIASFKRPASPGGYGIFTFAPKAALDREHRRDVVLHECAHEALAAQDENPHGERFDRLAQALGLPAESRR